MGVVEKDEEAPSKEKDSEGEGVGLELVLFEGGGCSCGMVDVVSEMYCRSKVRCWWRFDGKRLVKMIDGGYRGKSAWAIY